MRLFFSHFSILRLCRLMCGKPPALRCAAILLPLDGEAQPRHRESHIQIEIGKAEPFRTSGGGAAKTKSSSPPVDAININHQRLIFKWTMLPNSNTRPTIVFRALNQTRSHWILMNIINFLHKHILAENWQRIVVVFPKRVHMSACARSTLE